MLLYHSCIYTQTLLWGSDNERQRTCSSLGMSNKSYGMDPVGPDNANLHTHKHTLHGGLPYRT